MNWSRAKVNANGYEQAEPRFYFPSLDDCQRGVRSAVEVANRIGNERAGIKTDCLRCWKQLRLAVKSAPGRLTFRCSECGARWRREGHRLVRIDEP